jgi:hypothetical protein
MPIGISYVYLRGGGDGKDFATKISRTPCNGLTHLSMVHLDVTDQPAPLRVGHVTVRTLKGFSAWGQKEILPLKRSVNVDIYEPNIWVLLVNLSFGCV